VTGISRTRLCALAALCVVLYACPSVTLGLNPDLTVAAHLDKAPAIKAAAYLISPGSMRVNIESEPQTADACGVTLFVRALDPANATLEIRCPGTAKSPVQKDTAGAMGSLFERTGFSVISFRGVFTPESIDFTLGEETENAGCFQVETPDKSVFKGCFVAKGLSPAEEPKRLKPIIK